jgi:MFS family permease
MHLVALKRFSRTALFSVYLLSFFYTLHVALPVYVNSTFLATLVPENLVGTIYTAGSVLTIIALMLVPRMLKVVGDYYTTLSFIILEIICLLGIALSRSPAFIIGLFLVSTVLVWLISFDLDLIVEGYSKNADTGKVRGLYLTSANIAWVIAPALSVVLIAGDVYWRMYLAAAALFVPSLFIFALRLEHFKDPLYRTIHFRAGLAAIWKHKDIRYIFLAGFLLSFFFTLMVVYTPIYLYKHIGFGWSELGFIFSIMLLPFLLLESWLGRVADKFIGEKELLVAGFIIMALATGAMSFVTMPSFATWAGLLFLTRVGAAMVEIMTETYFFKKIEAGDAQIVSFQRTSRHVAGILGPLVGAVLISMFSIQYLFVALGIVMLLGIPIGLALKDTR